MEMHPAEGDDVFVMEMHPVEQEHTYLERHIGGSAIGVIELDEKIPQDPEQAAMEKLAIEQVGELQSLMHKFNFGKSHRDHKKQAQYLDKYLRDRYVLTPEAAEVLIEANHTNLVAVHLPRFAGVDHQTIAEQLIEANDTGALVLNLEKFKDLNEDVAWPLVEERWERDVAQYLGSFNEQLPNTLAHVLIQEARQGPAVIRNRHKFPGLTDTNLVNTLLMQEEYDLVIDNMQLWEGIDHNLVAVRIVNMGQRAARTLATRIQEFAVSDQTALAQEIITKGGADHVALNINKFSHANINTIVHTMIEAGHAEAVDDMLYNLDETAQLDPEIIMQAAVSQDSGLDLETMLRRLRVFAPFDHDKLYCTLVADGQVEQALDALSYLEVSEPDALIHNLIAANPEAGTLVGKKLNHLPVTDKVAVAEQLIDSGKASSFCFAVAGSNELKGAANSLVYRIMSRLDSDTGTDNLELTPFLLQHCTNLDKSVGRLLINSGYSVAVIQSIDNFEPNYKPIALRELIESNQVQVLLRHRGTFAGLAIEGSLVLNLLDRQQLSLSETLALANTLEFTNVPLAFEATLRLFGTNASDSTYAACKKLVNDGVIDSQLSRLGVTMTGKQGLEQLTHILDDMREKFIAPDIGTLELLLESSLLRAIFKDFVRYDDSQWGRQDDYSLKRHIQQAIDNQNHTILEHGYAPSDTVAVPLKAKTEVAPIPEDALLRYRRLHSVLMNAAAEINYYKIGDIPYERPISTIRDTLQAKVGRMALAHEKLTADSKQSQADFLDRQITELQTFIHNGLDSFEGLEEKFMKLHNENHTADALMTILTARALRFDPRLSLEARRQRFDRAEALIRLLPDGYGDYLPSSENLSRVIDLFGHVIAQETYGQEFKDPRAKRAIRELFSVKSLEHALTERSHAVGRSKNAWLQFVPSRDLLMELSGHIGDACWADRYPSIAQKFPNLTSVLMVRHFDKQPPRMVGSMMLVETTDDRTGEEYIVIRGLNPIENFINKTDVSGFFEAVKTYVEEIGKQRGKRTAVVIDWSHGASGTNRPLLHNYMQSIKTSLRPIRVPYDSTTFNGYDISHGKVYAFPE